MTTTTTPSLSKQRRTLQNEALYDHDNYPSLSKQWRAFQNEALHDDDHHLLPLSQEQTV